jgi:uncharacterized phage protein (TIGR01671 family)
VEAMKEIKYQIYHKPTKTIQEVALIDFNNRVLDTYGIDEPIYDIPFEDVEWRIYTGKKDKNSNDIYSRDIVKRVILNSTYIHKVYWDEEFSCFRPFASRFFWDDFEGGYNDGRIKAEEVEIIGNIDQNLELMEST